MSNPDPSFSGLIPIFYDILTQASKDKPEKGTTVTFGENYVIYGKQYPEIDKIFFALKSKDEGKQYYIYKMFSISSKQNQERIAWYGNISKFEPTDDQKSLVLKLKEEFLRNIVKPSSITYESLPKDKNIIQRLIDKIKGDKN